MAPSLDFRFGTVPFSGISLPLTCFDCENTEKEACFNSA